MGEIPKDKNILITGARGFLGHAMYDYLLQKGYKRVFDTNADLTILNEVVKETKDMDYVFHFAADMGGVGYFNQHQYSPTMNNLQMDMNMLRACEINSITRLFYPSSACAYPMYRMEKGFELSEYDLDLPADPDQMYGMEKYFMLKLMNFIPRVRVGVLHTIYGPGQAYKGEKAKFIPQMVHKFYMAPRNKMKVEVWGDGKQTRTFLHVDDAINKIYKVMASDEYHGPINIGSDKEVSVNEVIDLCSEIFNIKPEIIYNTSKPTGVKRRLCSNMKFNKYYGEAPEIRLDAGLTQVAISIINSEKIPK